MKSSTPQLYIATVNSVVVTSAKTERSNVAVLDARRTDNTKVIDMWSWQPKPPAAA